jgi:hypothetical protein
LPETEAVHEARERVAEQFRRQAATGIQRGSALYVELLERAADDIGRGGAAWRVLADRADAPSGSMVPLRLMAAVHRLVLEGAAPELARHYPSAGGSAAAGPAWPAFERVLRERADEIGELVDRPLQTNEVGRCAALVLGFAAVARATGLPLATLELGASAGLIVNWHRYRYETPHGSSGPPDSPVRFATPAEIDARLRVVAARGCDSKPLDVSDPEARLTLRSCIWADQPERLALLDAALEVAATWPPGVERADAVEWLTARLRDRPDGTATVIYHSIVLQYLAPAQRARLRALLEQAGTHATGEAPLAWLRLEPPASALAGHDRAPGLAELRLTLWPGGSERMLARAGYHGRPVRPVPP